MIRLTPSDVNRLKGAYMRAMLLRNEGDWLLAQIAHEVSVKTGSKEDRHTAYGRLGAGGGTKSKLDRMTEVLSTIKDEDVWFAVGWDGVRRLYSMRSDKRRKKISEIRLAANGGKLPRSVKSRILSMPSGEKPPASPGKPPTTTFLDEVLDALVNLVSFNDAILPLLPTRVRAAVKDRLPARKAAKRA